MRLRWSVGGGEVRGRWGPENVLAEVEVGVDFV